MAGLRTLAVPVRILKDHVIATLDDLDRKRSDSQSQSRTHLSYAGEGRAVATAVAFNAKVWQRHRAYEFNITAWSMCPGHRLTEHFIISRTLVLGTAAHT